jgi:hypothetical protein
MAGLKLIEEARSAGLKLIVEGDRLIIRGPKSAEPLALALLDRKAEILPFLKEQVSPTPAPFYDDAHELEPENWLCPHCGQPANIDDVFPSSDGERRLIMWSCGPCQVVAVTPDAIRQPPSGWVRRTKQ